MCLMYPNRFQIVFYILNCCEHLAIVDEYFLVFFCYNLIRRLKVHME